MYNCTSGQALGEGRATYGFTSSYTRTRSTSILSLHTPATYTGPRVHYAAARNP